MEAVSRIQTKITGHASSSFVAFSLSLWLVSSIIIPILVPDYIYLLIISEFCNPIVAHIYSEKEDIRPTLGGPYNLV